MLATFSPRPHGLAAMTLPPSGSLASNTAGSPLPRIPRRAPTSQRTYPGGFTTPSKVTTSPVKITVQQATPPDDSTASTSRSADASGGSSSAPSSSLSPTRVQGIRGPRKVPATPVDPVSPTFGIPRSKKERSSSQPENKEKETESQPPALSLSVEALLSRAHSETLLEFPSVEPDYHQSAPLPPVLAVRKKSGQLVKPSLKGSRTAFKGSLSVTPGGLSSKSEPATPTVPKAVKFDSRLEHVKLFLAEQRPLAVSRDGSPTDDTSGTESDFPSFIFGKSKTLQMTVANMPLSLNPNADIVMEEMKLSSDGFSIAGRARVRNISFQKWVAVRFTFDEWQTTSEVTAKYVESADGEFDIFGFTIRLSDLMACIEEKTLIVALRYNVDGREIWDNNFGRNYVVKFSKEMPKPVEKPSISSIGSDRHISSGNDISDLQSRLEKVVKKRDEAAATPPFQSTNSLTSPLNAETSLSSRYDFGASLKNVFSTTTALRTRDHTRMHSYPLVTSASVGSIPWPEMSKRRRSIPKEDSTLGSPRDLEDTFRPAPFIPSDSDDGPEIAPVTRNHQRGYFDLSLMGSSSIKMSSPGTPRSLDDTTPPSSARYYSLPSLRPVSPYHASRLDFGLAPISIADAIDSLISPPMSEASTPTRSSPFPIEMVSVSPRTNYNQFLNRFCFFTGSESSSGNSSDESESLSRSSSISSVDEFMSSNSPRLPDAGGFHLFSPQPVTQTRDDISIRISSEFSSTPRSRSVTPTPK